MDAYLAKVSGCTPPVKGYGMPRSTVLDLGKKLIFLVILLSAPAYPSMAQFDAGGSDKVVRNIDPEDVIHWRPGAAQLYPDNTIEANLQLFTEQEFTIYTDKLKFSGPAATDLVKVVGPEPVSQTDPITGEETQVYKGGDFRIFFSASTRPLNKDFELEITYLGCTTRICLFPHTQKLKLPIYETAAEAALTQVSPTSEIKPAAPAYKEDLETRLAGKLKKGEFSFYMMLVIVFLGGLLTNLTPCVAPMIPITVRLLAKQKFTPLTNASLYAAGIMVTYTILGSVATLSGSAFGTFMQLGAVNLVFAIVMALLGLSMLGFGDLSALQNIGSKIGSGKPSAKNTFLMGAGAGLVAAPCTGPILGALLTYTAGQQAPGQGMILMAVYSFGFSLPYVLLGTAASSVSKVRVSPLVQVGIKLVFSAIMFGLAFYYARIPAYSLLQVLKPHMGLLAAICLGLGAGILAVCVATPKLQNNKFALLLPCLLIGGGLFTGSQWLTTASSHEALTVHMNRDEAFALAKAQNKGIILDNWAEWCEACKKMDVTTFVDTRVINELNQNWILLKTDLTQDSETNTKHMEEFEISGLPTLVILPPDGDKTKKLDVIGYASADVLLNRLQEFKGK